MDETSSLLVVLSDEDGLRQSIIQAVAQPGWQCRTPDGLQTALDLTANQDAVVFVVDAEACEPAAAVAAVRALPPPAASVPIIVIGAEGTPTLGAGGCLSRPFDEAAFLAMLEHWSGPLRDHDLRAPPFGARYRLIRLLGLANATAMFDRFAVTLEEAIEIAARAPTEVPAHRLAGLSGMIGFEDLHELWSRVDAGEAGALDRAVAASRQFLEKPLRPGS